MRGKLRTDTKKSICAVAVSTRDSLASWPSQDHHFGSKSFSPLDVRCVISIDSKNEYIACSVKIRCTDISKSGGGIPCGVWLARCRSVLSTLTLFGQSRKRKRPSASANLFFSSYTHCLFHHNVQPCSHEVACPQTIGRQSIVQEVSSHHHPSSSTTYERRWVILSITMPCLSAHLRQFTLMSNTSRYAEKGIVKVGHKSKSCDKLLFYVEWELKVL